MKPARMLMVTSLYPYGQGETFVTAELEHVARSLERIGIVPGFYVPGTSPRPARQSVDLAYADTRWGFLRVPRMLACLLLALVHYRWAGDLATILARPRKLDNLKELVRALYRARMFEHFLGGLARRARSGAAHACGAGSDAGIDIIYFYWMVPEIAGALHFRKASGAPLRIVCRAHRGDLYEDLKPGGYAGLRRTVMAGIDDVYCISEHGARYLAGCFPAASGKIHVFRLGVDDPGFLNRQPYDGPLSIVSCAFVIASKRLHLIVDAMACLLAADPALQIRWTHVGDGPLLEQVRAHAAKRLGGFGARAQAVFEGYRTQAELMALYRAEAFDVIANVSDSEGIPVSLMEACAAGMPMVAADVGGNAEIVNGANGVLLPADAGAAAIAAALLRFNDRAAARAVRAAARRHWAAHFDAAANYARFGRELAGGGQAPPHAAAGAAPVLDVVGGDGPPAG